ncbi:MAG: nucleotidyltransferase family protein [Synechococcaceae cyanobacterium SM2_3_2]|nr:nucleotidyltransferase family protein [Synechococcaceae cyanobacterium SM2_3_2]
MSVAIAILAAGHGSRFGGAQPKPLVLWRGIPLLDHAISAALASGASPVVVVVGYQADQVILRVSARVQTVVNLKWQEGLASSLKAALIALESLVDLAGVCIGLADQPLIGTNSYRRLITAANQGAELAVATYDGQRRNPVYLSRKLWPQVMQLTGDSGARQLMATHLVTEVSCDDTGDPFDVDTPADLAYLLAQTPRLPAYTAIPLPLSPSHSPHHD